MSANADDWMQTVQQLFQGNGSPIYLPATVFVVNVRDNRASYAGLAEPRIDAKGATLRLHDVGQFQELDAAAVNALVDRIKAWYDVLPKQLMPA